MKNILCALMEPNDFLLQRLAEAAGRRGWQVEYCGRRVPRGWSGEGILSDYLEMEDFRPVARFGRTPVVSRLLPARGNVRTVRSDTDRIARMVADYLCDKGFTRFATVARRIYPEDIDGKPRDVLEAFRRALARRGHGLETCLWDREIGPEAYEDYEQRCRTLRRFFAGLQTPFALFLSQNHALAVVYRVLREMGLRVPEEVAIFCNTDDPLVAESASVPTTHLGGEHPELARKLVELLEQMVDGVVPPERPVFVASAGIISRRSTDTIAVSDLRVAKAVSFFFQHYGDVVGVEAAARRAGVSRGVLSRLFRRHFGKSPHRFLFEIRLNRICQLLDATDWPLEEIARRSGYGSDMALSLAFKRETGMTPGAYRADRHHLREAGGERKP